MKFGFIPFLKSLKHFILGGGRHLVFTALFYSLWFAWHIFSGANFSLKNFNKRMVGMGNFFDYDVNARVSLFYKCGLVFVAVFLLICIAGHYAAKWKREFFYRPENRIINYSSLCGIFLLFLQLCGFQTIHSIELIYFIHKLMLLALILSFFSRSQRNISLNVYVVLICLSWGLYFFISDIFILFGAAQQPDQLIVTFIIAIALIGARLFLRTLNERKNELRILHVMLPLLLLPVVSVLKDEIYLVFAGKNIHVEPFLPWITLTSLLTIAVFLRNRKLNKKPDLLKKASATKLLSLRYFPLLVFSMLVYNLYSYYIHAFSEVFEAANKYLPLMEFKNWGVVPILEKYNSHVLSDFFFSGIYSFFNGMKGNEVELYDFLVNVVNGVLYYFLILFISRNAFIAAFTVLAYPFYLSICPDEHAFMILGIFVIHKLLKEGSSLKNMLLFFSSIVFLMFWKIDVGFACILLMPLTYFFYWRVVKKTDLNARNLLISFCFVSGALLLVIGTIAVARHINILKNAGYVLGYLDSVQTYGWTFLGEEGKLAHQMHYFVFPLLVLSILLLLLFRFKELNRNSKQRLAWLSLFMIILYYIANFQRGLVRHSLYENNDSYASSFAYLVLSLSPFVFFYRSKIALRYGAYCCITFFGVYQFKYPAPDKPLSHTEQNLGKIKISTLTAVETVKKRTRGDSLENPAKNLIAFLRQNLQGNETFVDFTDHPMLYYYSEKITPSFFYQNPICSHTDHLQESFVKDLSKYDAPYLLYEYYDPKNNYRNDEAHCFYRYKIAEYLNRNYHPYLYVDHFAVWKRNGFEREDTLTFKNFRPDICMSNYPNCNLYQLPHNWGEYDEKLKEEKILFDAGNNFRPLENMMIEVELPQNLDKSSGNTLVFKIKSNSDKKEQAYIRFRNNDGSGAFELQMDVLPSAKTETYAIRVSCEYKWYLNDVRRIVLQNFSGGPVKLEKLYITKGL